MAEPDIDAIASEIKAFTASGNLPTIPKENPEAPTQGGTEGDAIEVASEAPPEEVASEEAAPTEEQLPPAEEKPPESVSKGLSALARKEAALRQKEQAFKAEQAKWVIEKASFEAKQKQIETALKRFSYDPVGFAKSLGIAESQMQDLGAMFMYASMGTNLPPEMMRKKEQIELRQQNEETRGYTQQLEQQLIAYQQAQKVEAWKGGVKQQLGTLGDSAPNLKRLVSKNGDKALQRFVAHAEEWAQANPGLLLPEFSELAETLEAKLADEAAIWRDENKTQATQKTKAPITSLNSKQVNSISRPRVEPQSDEELESELINDLRSGKHIK